VSAAAWERYRFENVDVDPQNHRVTVGEAVRTLEPKSFRLLQFLIENRRRVVTKAEIVSSVWEGAFVTDNAITRAVTQIRKALGDDAKEPRFIETIPTVGYRFLPEVEASAPEVRRNTVPALDPPAGVEPSGRSRFPAERRFVLPMLAVVAVTVGAYFWLVRTEYFWQSPIAKARFQTLTDFDVEEAAAVSRDGHLVAFLSDRDGQVDVWLAQADSAQFHNLTRGNGLELVNPSVRTLGFSPDGSAVTFWVRKHDSGGNDISIWAAPILGGQPRPYLEGVAEFDWSQDGSRLVYHTPDPGDPLFVSDGVMRTDRRPLFTAPSGLHCHFPLWSPDGAFLYFVLGSPPDKLDIWRISSAGGIPERITSHNSRVTHPVFLDRRTLMYLASDPDGSGPWLYSIDVERRIPHRLTFGPDRYTSLAASVDGRRLVVTRSSPRRTLWRLALADASTTESTGTRIALTTATGFSPRLGPNYLLYVSATGTSESIWKLANGIGTELWSGQDAHILGGPAISRDWGQIAFSVRQRGQTLLYAVRADGTKARVIGNSLDLQGDPAWAPDGQSILTAVNDHGVPHLFRISIQGRVSPFVPEYSVDPTWAPDGQFVVYSGPDIGTMFSVKAVTSAAAAYPLPDMMLTRGARRLTFMPGKRELLFLRGGIQHKDLWLVNLETGVERPLTRFTPDFNIADFDISPDGREVVIERVQERSDVVLLDLARP
jgi:Tol biopolymer transport system component/DNA-binding winged helix-turn-helix (wHTH) protein